MKRIYDFDPKNIPERVITIFHNCDYYANEIISGRTDRQITSEAWDMHIDTAKNNDYVFSCVNGEVVGVYKIDDVYPSMRKRARSGKNSNDCRLVLVLNEDGRGLRDLRKRYLGRVSKAYHRPYVSSY